MPNGGKIFQVLLYTLNGAVCSATQQTMYPSGYERFVKPLAFSGKELIISYYAAHVACAPGQQPHYNSFICLIAISGLVIL